MDQSVITSAESAVDTEKPVVIIGKGHSARHIPRSLEYYVAGISESVLMADWCHWCGINDVVAWQAMTYECWRRIGTLVIPTDMHCDTRGSKVVSHTKVQRWLRAMEASAGGAIPHTIELIQLHTARIDPDGAVKVGRCWSTAESMLALLIHKGFRHFITTGVEKDITYHESFKPRRAKNRNHFKINYQRMCDRVLKVEAKMERWEETEFLAE